MSSLKSTNLTCGYFDEDVKLWLLGEAGNLTTIFNKETNQVLCITSHLSRFAIFNFTQLAPEVINTDLNDFEEENRQRIIVSYIQLGLIVLAFMLFIIQLIKE